MNNAASHNAFYVRRDITSYYQDGSLWDRIAGTNGYDEFEGLFPGCYFVPNNNLYAPAVAGGGGSPASRINIVGLNCFIAHGSNNDNPSTKISYNHIVACPDQFGSSYFYDVDDLIIDESNKTVHAYKDLFVSRLVIGPVAVTPNSAGTINEQLLNEFGSHLKTHKEFLPTAIVNCDKTNYNPFMQGVEWSEPGFIKKDSWIDVQAILFSEFEITGREISTCASFMGDRASIMQFPLFKISGLRPNYATGISKNTQMSILLRNVAGRGVATQFDYKGNITVSNASISSDGLTVVGNFRSQLVPRFILA